MTLFLGQYRVYLYINFIYVQICALTIKVEIALEGLKQDFWAHCFRDLEERNSALLKTIKILYFFFKRHNEVILKNKVNMSNISFKLEKRNIVPYARKKCQIYVYLKKQY